METFAARAGSALDALGWADTTNPMEVTRATMDLARVVRDMAGALDRIIAAEAAARKES